MTALHEPDAGHTAYEVTAMESAPHFPPAVASVRVMHLPLAVSQPTA